MERPGRRAEIGSFHRGRRGIMIASPRFKSIAHLPLLLAALVILPVVSPQSPPAAPAAQPVLVELFTSEGCSDCPPADAFLAQLDAHQFAPGAQAIVLSEHVTYWNHQGWSDRFSLEDVDLRQQEYVRQFSLPSPGTPEFVVDGAQEVGGFNPRQIVQQITDAATKPKLSIEIGDTHRGDDGSINFTVAAAPGAKANVVAAVAENATQSAVSGGENKGQTLRNVAVVRVIKDFGSNAGDGRPLRLSSADLLHAEKDGEPLRLVVFLVSHKDHRVVGVAEKTLNP